MNGDAQQDVLGTEYTIKLLEIYSNREMLYIDMAHKRAEFFVGIVVMALFIAIAGATIHKGGGYIFGVNIICSIGAALCFFARMSVKRTFYRVHQHFRMRELLEHEILLHEIETLTNHRRRAYHPGEPLKPPKKGYIEQLEKIKNSGEGFAEYCSKRAVGQQSLYMWVFFLGYFAFLATSLFAAWQSPEFSRLVM